MNWINLDWLKKSNFYRQLYFQYQQRLIYGCLFHSQEQKSNIAFETGFTGTKDRKFIQNQILSIVRSQKGNLKIKKFFKINHALISKYSSLNFPLIVKKFVPKLNLELIKSTFSNEEGIVYETASTENYYSQDSKKYQMKIGKFFDLLPTSKYFLENLNMTSKKITKKIETKLNKILRRQWKLKDIYLQIGNRQELNIRTNQENCFIFQLKGSRILNLYDNIQKDLLYVDPLNPKFSVVKSNEKNSIKFPLLNKAKPIQITLHPGDMLYLPYGWFYSVFSQEENMNINYSYHTLSRSLKIMDDVLSSFYWKDPYDRNSQLKKNRRAKIENERERSSYIPKYQ
eukprot:gene3533-6268_t